MNHRFRLVLATLLAVLGFAAAPAAAHYGDYNAQRSVAWNHACGGYNRCTYNTAQVHGPHSRVFWFANASSNCDRQVFISDNLVIFGSTWYCW
jgi:hypothetical protein